MKLKMAENSLFAVLLRSPWWVSVLLAGAAFLAMRYFLAAMYAFAGALPFMVIAAAAAWKQLRAPSEAKVATGLEALRALSWEDFSRALEEGFRRQGYEVTRAEGAADFALEKSAQLTLVAARRWKASVTGVEPLRELAAAGAQRGAGECVYVCAAALSDKAKDFAIDKRIRRLEGAELVQLARL